MVLLSFRVVSGFGKTLRKVAMPVDEGTLLDECVRKLELNKYAGVVLLPGHEIEKVHVYGSALELPPPTELDVTLLNQITAGDVAAIGKFIVLHEKEERARACLQRDAFDVLATAMHPATLVLPTRRTADLYDGHIYNSLIGQQLHPCSARHGYACRAGHDLPEDGAL